MEFPQCPEHRQLVALARENRTSIIRSLAEAGSGHLGGSLGLADIFTWLYFSFLRHTPHEPEWPGRDRLILSIGHVAPVLYSSLALCGYFPKEELLTLRKLGSRLQGHPGKDHGLPGIEISSGSLGQGLSVAVGLGLAARIDQRPSRILCIMGDGELQEGSVWEAAMSAAHHRLSNLIAIVDRNRLQIDGSTAEVMEIEPLADKWTAFGWKVFQCNGHDFGSIEQAFRQMNEQQDFPQILIAHTVMGKGVKAIENNNQWHGRAPTQQEAGLFIREINS